MVTGEWDALESFVAETLYAEGLIACDAVVKTCDAHHSASVHTLVLALASAASAFKFEWKNGAQEDLVKLLDLHEALFGLAINLAGLELSGKSVANCGDLLDYWHMERDPQFRVNQFPLACCARSRPTVRLQKKPFSPVSHVFRTEQRGRKK